MTRPTIPLQVIPSASSADARGGYWRSLEELAARRTDKAPSPEFAEWAETWMDAPSRRRFLELMAASLALAGVGGCGRQPDERIVPYVEMPEQIVPGKPLYFATAMPMSGQGLGLVVESHMGRPTKIEGNSLHPASLGATDAWAQASILSLYDPDRSQAIKLGATISSREAFLRAFRRELDLEQGGAGLRILTETVGSPTLAWQIQRLTEQVFPEMQWHQYEAVVCDALWRGAEMAFGRIVQPLYDFRRADVILSIGADFLHAGPWPIPYARHFVEGRRVARGTDVAPSMNRLYVVESTATITGSKADHRLPLPPSDVPRFVRALAARLQAIGGASGAELPASVPAEWFEALVEDLQSYRRSPDAGGPLIVAGSEQPAEVHALVFAMHQALGCVGTTVQYREPSVARAERQLESLARLVDDMRRGQVQRVMILHGNPVFDAPADLGFAEALQQVPFRVYLGLYENETSARCHWHLPALHFLEAWSDVRAFDGTASIIQPLIAPLYSGWSEHTLLEWMASGQMQSDHEIVRAFWRQQLGGNDTSDDEFEKAWEDALQQGIIPGTESPTVQVTVNAEAIEQATAEPPGEETSSDGSAASRYTVVLRPDPTIWDGRFANNGWLQELPKPLTKLTWDNVALVNPLDATREGLQSGDVVRLVDGSRHVVVPVWPMPGHPRGCITVYFGYGRQRAGRVGSRVGTDAYALRTLNAPWVVQDVQLQPTGQNYELAATQHHHSMEGRHPVEQGSLEALRADPQHPSFLHHPHHSLEPSLYPEWSYEYPAYKWGMAIDLTACSGCSACVVACQAENNIPIVGKDQVLREREMHWLRIDTYFHGSADNPPAFHQPVPCMHCEKAPCEVVCPVAATTHSNEGINEMTYNRCIGTRYCSNNCPYKVRRFNFLQYSDYETPVLALLRNPDVTVRSRGVMEKCTYCIQRINAARVQAKLEDRRIEAGEVETACQAACPTQAIVFGDLNNPEDPVSQLAQNPLNYSLLRELNTQPRTTYLAEVRNPNPALAPAAESAGHST